MKMAISEEKRRNGEKQPSAKRNAASIMWRQ
jgi:hypothetical protein